MTKKRIINDDEFEDEDDDFRELLNERLQAEENELINEYGEEIDPYAAGYNAGWNWVPPDEDEDESDEEDEEDII